MTAPSEYAPPLDQLLTYGECEFAGRSKWPNYVEEIGLTPDHIPELIRMATDASLNEGNWETDPWVWAPVHAWRSLGQLRAEAAIDTLIPLFHRDEEDDWVREEIPVVLGQIGPAALPALQAYLASRDRAFSPRVAAAYSIRQIGQKHPESREQCIQILVQQLEQFTQNGPIVNGFIVGELMDLKAKEAAPTMERAFAAQCVDASVAGDWLYVQEDLGLISAKEHRELKAQGPSQAKIPFAAAVSQRPSKSNSQGFGSSTSGKKKKKKK